MQNTQLVILENEHRQLSQICDKLLRDSMAKSIFLVDKIGQLITSCGQVETIDTTALASLVAGATAATGGLAGLLGEEEFPAHYHQGAQASLYVALIGSELILAVIFDNRSTEGLVRLRVKRASTELAEIFSEMSEKAVSDAPANLFGEITDEDIENLFSDTF